MAIPSPKNRLVETLRRWQDVETEAVVSAAEVIAEATNPLVLLVMEIIQADCQRHHWVLDLIAESLQTGSLSLTASEIEELSEVMDRHARFEQAMAESVEQAMAEVRTHGSRVHEYLFSYLLADEKKHIALLRGLSKLKENLKENKASSGPP